MAFKSPLFIFQFPSLLKQRTPLSIIGALLFLMLVLPKDLHAQIWQEDFSGANQGWTQNFTDCDGTAASFAGVQNNRFEIIDMEGAPCCPSGGGGDNEWVTNPINIAGFCNVGISVSYGFSGSFECVAGGPYFGCQGNVAIDNGHDQIVFQYRINGGPWIQFAYVCGGMAGTATINGLSGTTLEIRIQPSNKSTAETYWFDNVSVTGTTAPVMTQPADITVCANSPVSAIFTGPSGTVYNWTNNNTAIGLGASGTGNVNFTSANVATQQVGTITVTPTLPSCPGPPVTFTVTVNPLPVVADPPNITVCANETVNVTYTGGNGGATFNWTNNNTAIGLGASGSGDLSFTSANVAATQVGTVTVSANENGCPGPTQNFTITVNPAPTVNIPANITVCGGGPVTVNFSGTPGGVTYSWTNDNTTVGLGASGTGNISFTSANVANQEIANITVSPQFGTCPGTPQTFTITINPTPTVDDPPNLSVCGGDPVGVTFTGTGSPTFNWTNTNPSIGLSGSGTGDINFTAASVAGVTTGIVTVTPVLAGCPGTPQNFNISVSPTPVLNQPNDVTVCGGAPVVVNFNGTPGGNIYNWTNDNPSIGLGASGTGNISFTSLNVANQEIANITVTPQNGACPGIPRTFAIIINPSPTVNDPGDQNVCAGDPVNLVFTGNGNPNFSWTNNNTAIGLGASGNGDINFNAANVATTQTGTITVTPTSGGCPGTPQLFTITVAPAPTANQPANVVVCAGAPVNVTFAGTPVGVTYSWTNDNPVVGLGASGNGNISFTSANVTNQEIANITVTPQFGTCPGVPRTFTITINPTPVLTDPLDQAVCAGDPVVVNFAATGNPTLNWTNSNPAIGLGASGNGDINFTAANVATTQTGTITVTPNASGCPGTPQSFTVTVAPIPTANQPANVVVCAGAPVNVAFAGTPAGVTYSWTNDNPAVGLGASGNGNISFTSANVTTQQIANIIVTPQSGTCPGVARTFTITINPAAVLNQPADVLVCGGQPVNVNFTGTAGATFNWTNSNIATGLGASGSGNISYTSPNVVSTTTGVVTVTPTANGCPGTPLSFSITIESQPTATAPVDQIICGNQAVNIALSGSAGSFNWTNSNPAIGLAASGTGNLVFTSADVVNPQSAVITITPQIGTCTGATVQFNITVNPTPQVSPPADLQVCATNVLQIDFSANQTGTSFTWTNDNTGIGLGASGNGSIMFTAANVAAALVGNISVTPVLGTCNGVPQTFAITVQPAATMTNPGDQNVCGGNVLNVNFVGAAGTIFNWTNNNPAIGLGATGNGNINFTAANVAGPTTGTISVTPVNGTCTGPTQTFNITVVTVPTVTNPGITNACANTPVGVTFGTGNTVYNWTNNNPAIGLAASGTGNLSFIGANVTAVETAQITVTPQIGTCTGVAEVFTININPAPVATITGVTTLCSGDGTTLTANGGTNFNWSGGQMSNSITVVPNATTNYAVIVSDAVGCTALANTTVTVNPLNITNLSASSCNPLDTGVVVTNFFNQFGCDSTVILTTQFLPSNTVNLSSVTCNPANAGVFTQNLTNIFGCDSTVINTITFDPANIDTTILSATTCIPANAVPTQVLLVGVDGCDSLVITNTTLLPSNTINLSAVTCKPAEAGVFTQNLTNIFGCDSTVTTTVVFDPSLIDTTFLNAKTCLPGQVGQVAQTFLGANGCDSILILNRTLAPSYALTFSTITCKPNEAGVFTQNLVSIDGCDSIRTTTVVFDPSLIDSTFLTAVTCNAAQVGIAQIILSGSNGCDSVVITNTTLAPPITNTVNVFTCKPNNAGTFIDTYNINGCDSVVTRIVVFDPSQLDTTQITLTTCDQTQAGQLIETLLGIDDCDSVVVRTTVYDPTLCAPSGVISSTPTTCADNDDGQVTVLINAGLPPFQYNWIDGQGNSGSGTTAGLNTAFQIPGLAAGTFSITITQSTGPTLTLQSVVTAPPALSVLATSLQSYNGFGVRCAGDTDGVATASVSGGTGPYQYLWSNGDTLAAASNLGEGDYTVTITDKNGCPAVGTTSLNAPDPLRFILAVDRPDCGEQVADVAITPLGGVQLYDVFLDGNLVSGTVPSIGSGTHNIVVQDANDCIADSTFSLVVPESGVISLPSDTVVQLGQVLIIEAQTNLDVWRSISWSPLADSSCANCLTQTWIPFSSGSYTVTQVDTFGCVSKATIRVIVKKTSPVYVPNVFSPDNRNDNDLFTIGAGPSVLRMEELRIFDRWGNAVYILDTPIGPNEWPGWDGRVGGKEVGVGVYVYYLKVRLVDGTIELISGDLTVINN